MRFLALVICELHDNKFVLVTLRNERPSDEFQTNLFRKTVLLDVDVAILAGADAIGERIPASTPRDRQYVVNGTIVRSATVLELPAVLILVPELTNIVIPLIDCISAIRDGFLLRLIPNEFKQPDDQGHLDPDFHGPDLLRFIGKNNLYLIETVPFQNLRDRSLRPELVVFVQHDNGTHCRSFVTECDILLLRV
jgi:hypothetical protein